jgi:histidyl-tRNA synthetase
MDATPDSHDPWADFDIIGDDEPPGPDSEVIQLAAKLAHELGVSFKHMEFMLARLARLAAAATQLASRLKPGP